MLKKTLMTLIALLLFTVPALAGNVTLAWDHNDPLPEGYLVFVRQQGQTYNYDQPAWTGPENSATLELPEAFLYYFVVRAYEGPLQSADSIEVNYMMPTEGIDSVSGTRIERVVIININ